MISHPEPRERIYHRLESPTQTPADARLQVESGEIWGRPRRYSDIPSVKAYPGPLPPGARGIEFTTEVPPDAQTGPDYVRWTGPRPGVIVEGGYARIVARVIRSTQVP